MSSLLGIKPTTVLRVLSFGAGVGAASGVYFYTHRQLWSGTAQVAQLYGAPSPEQSTPHGEAPELFYGARTRATLVRGWNLAVDSTLGALATELAKRGI